MLRRSRQSGFTLLEVLIAIAILATGLTLMVQATSQAIQMENHAKLESTATFLARQRLVQLEDDLIEKGFTDDSFAKEQSGDFDDKGFKRFKWTVVIEKVTLPATDQVQNMVSQAIQSKQTLAGGGSDPLAAAQQNMPGINGSSGSSGSGSMAGAGMLGGIFPIVKDVLEQGIRRAHVTISWNELGRERSVEIYEYLTDPRRVDMAIGMGAGALAGGAGQPGQNGQPGSSPGGSSPGGSPSGGSPSPMPASPMGFGH